MITPDQFEKAKQFIYRHGRLLERKRFEFHFEGASAAKLLQVLACYQNDDGGFGNGIELDVMAPVSTPIGAETAMLLLDELRVTEGEIVDGLESWILSSQSQSGPMPPMPSEVAEYPHGHWWTEPDENRVLSLAGLLGKWGRGSTTFFDRIHTQVQSWQMPSPISIYHYPWYLYFLHAPGVLSQDQGLHAIREGIPSLLQQHQTHHPLFMLAWSQAAEDVCRETLESQTEQWRASLQEDGGLEIPYPDLPWWRPIWTLDGLVGLKKHGLLPPSLDSK